MIESRARKRRTASGRNTAENPIFTSTKKKIATGKELIRKTYSRSRRAKKEPKVFMGKSLLIFQRCG
jgi:hypothetical protein